MARSAAIKRAETFVKVRMVVSPWDGVSSIAFTVAGLRLPRK